MGAFARRTFNRIWIAFRLTATDEEDWSDIIVGSELLNKLSTAPTNVILADAHESHVGDLVQRLVAYRFAKSGI